MPWFACRIDALQLSRPGRRDWIAARTRTKTQSKVNHHHYFQLHPTPTPLRQNYTQLNRNRLDRLNRNRNRRWGSWRIGWSTSREKWRRSMTLGRRRVWIEGFFQFNKLQMVQPGSVTYVLALCSSDPMKVTLQWSNICIEVLDSCAEDEGFSNS
jgi:hypothetical protein